MSAERRALVMDAAGELPLWLTLGYTGILLLIVPVYLVRYGPTNFLWFSDVALIAAGVALWLEHRLLASAMAVGVLLPELLWNVSFLSRLLTGAHVSSLADYMFDPAKSRFMRGLSLLLHVAMPVTLVWILARLGYDPRAPLLQTGIAWIVLPITYIATPPAQNVNWVFGFGHPPRRLLPPGLHMAALMLGFPLLVYLPTHFLLQAIFS